MRGLVGAVQRFSSRPASHPRLERTTLTVPLVDPVEVLRYRSKMRVSGKAAVAALVVAAAGSVAAATDVGALAAGPPTYGARLTITGAQTVILPGLRQSLSNPTTTPKSCSNVAGITVCEKSKTYHGYVTCRNGPTIKLNRNSDSVRAAMMFRTRPREVVISSWSLKPYGSDRRDRNFPDRSHPNVRPPASIPLVLQHGRLVAVTAVYAFGSKPVIFVYAFCTSGGTPPA